jgi:hypothetical protein
MEVRATLARAETGFPKAASYAFGPRKSVTRHNSTARTDAPPRSFCEAKDAGTTSHPAAAGEPRRVCPHDDELDRPVRGTSPLKSVDLRTDK